MIDEQTDLPRYRSSRNGRSPVTGALESRAQQAEGGTFSTLVAEVKALSGHLLP